MEYGDFLAQKRNRAVYRGTNAKTGIAAGHTKNPLDYPTLLNFKQGPKKITTSKQTVVPACAGPTCSDDATSA